MGRWGLGKVIKASIWRNSQCGMHNNDDDDDDHNICDYDNDDYDYADDDIAFTTQFNTLWLFDIWPYKTPIYVPF